MRPKQVAKCPNAARCYRSDLLKQKGIFCISFNLRKPFVMRFSAPCGYRYERLQAL
jgi:hypothetical protein